MTRRKQKTKTKTKKKIIRITYNKLKNNESKKIRYWINSEPLCTVCLRCYIMHWDARLKRSGRKEREKNDKKNRRGRVEESNDMLNVSANKHNKITKDNTICVFYGLRKILVDFCYWRNVVSARIRGTRTRPHLYIVPIRNSINEKTTLIENTKCGAT